MPIQEQTLQAELNSMAVVKKTEILDPTNCPTCRSGVIEYPPAIMTDVVSVDL